MKKYLQSLVLLLAVLMAPLVASAAPVQVADGVYRDGSTLYIGSGVTSLGSLNLNPSVIYCFATVPPVCVSNTFTGFGATLHMPPASYGAYFVNEYWGNFSNMYNDAVEPTGVTLSRTEANMTAGEAMTLTATIAPTNASLRTVTWSSSNPSVATVSGGQISALAAGECDIIATCLDKQAVCHVKVTQTTIVITLDKHEVRLQPNHSVTITPTMTPMETTLKVTVSDTEVAAARLVNGKVQVVGLTEGATMIVVSSVDGQAVPDVCMVTVYTELGDVNCDGFVNIADVTSLIDLLLGGDAGSYNAENADTNKDDTVNIADVTALIDYLLIGYWPWVGILHENDWVDLGLPSGTRWATMNVGANSPEEYGDYFAWGETTPKDVYDWSSYKWCNGSASTLTKYCIQSRYGYNGFTDGKSELDLEDDAAYVNWGPSWRMPTWEQQKELGEKCTWTWTTRDGVNGQLGTGPNGNTIFLPASGERRGESLGNVGSYWSRALGPDYSYSAFDLDISSYGVSLSLYLSRCRGYSVRAVRVP